MSSSKALRNMKRILKRTEFWFTVIVYPVGTCLYFYLIKKLNMSTFSESTLKWYSGLSFIILAGLTIYTAWELAEKNIFHKRQGDKLKIKAGQKDWKH